MANEKTPPLPAVAAPTSAPAPKSGELTTDPDDVRRLASNEIAIDVKTFEQIQRRLMELDALDMKIKRMESDNAAAMSQGNPIVAITCNSCGTDVTEMKDQRCERHPNEHMNHITVVFDRDRQAKMPVIAKQTRAA